MEPQTDSRREIDERIRFRMDNNATKGTKLRVVQVIDSPDYPNIEKLNFGDVVTVECTDERSWSTRVYLQEFPGLQFNSVCFVEEEAYQQHINHQPMQCPRCKSLSLLVEDNRARTIFSQESDGYWTQVKNQVFGQDNFEYECEQCGHVWSSDTVSTEFFRYRTVFNTKP